MAEITATFDVPVTVAWLHGNQPAGEQPGTAKATVTRNVDDPENWTAIGNWEAGQATATVTGGGSGDGGGSSEGGGGAGSGSGGG